MLYSAVLSNLTKTYSGNTYKYTTHACRALIEMAQKADPSMTIFAKTSPEKNASTTILERCGFVFSGIVQDHEIGNAWEWILPS